MRLINQSRFPDAEVEALVRFAFQGIRDTGIVVKVKNCRGAYRGRAYHGVPIVSPEYGKVTAKRLVTIGIGPDSKFPQSNMRTVNKVSREVQMPDNGNLPTPESITGEKLVAINYSFDRQGLPIKVYAFGTTERHPYGGKGSPEITVNDWREALVTVAAHEARHIWQFQQRDAGKGRRLGEVDAERHAAKRLADYRDHTPRAGGARLGAGRARG